jgi:hypothetical protein
MLIMQRKILLAVCVVLTSQTFGQSSEEEPSAPATSHSVLTERLKAISSARGGQPTDCVAASADFGSVGDCVRNQFRQHKPFLWGYEGTPRLGRFVVGTGVAGDAAGNVFTIFYDRRGFPPVALNRHMQLMDDLHTRVIECIKPVSFDTKPQGAPACVLPVNQKRSQIAARRKPVDTTVCSVLKNPSAFNNKLVRIRAYYWGNFENSTLNDNRCRGSIWLRYAGGTAPPSFGTYVSTVYMPGSEDSKGKRILPIPVALVRDSRFERFEALVRENRPLVVPLIGDPDGKVTATFIGRIDGVSAEVHQFLKGQPPGRAWLLGFGHLGGYEAQLVLQSVGDDATLQ